MRTFNKNVLAVGLMACSSAAFAAKPGTPTLGDVLDASGVSITGYVDTSYTYLTGSGAFSSGTADRVFDTNRNSFNLQMVDITGSYLPAQGFGGLVNFNFGPDADVVAAAAPVAGINTKEVQQAFVQYANGPLTIMGGKYVTLAGAEVIKSRDDTNFSRSILFGYAIPFAHTGVRAAYALSDTSKLYIGLNNGWDNQKDNNSQKTVELGAALAPSKQFLLNAVLYSGTEVGTTGLQGRRDLLDVVATFNASDALSFVVNMDFAKQKDALGSGSDAKWNGIAGYVNYTINSQWRTSVRLEHFNDKDGYRTGVVQKWKEATATLAYMPTKSVELRGELRADTSDKSVFVQTDGTTKKSQQSIGLEALYKF